MGMESMRVHIAFLHGLFYFLTFVHFAHILIVFACRICSLLALRLGPLKSWNVINTPEKHEKETHPLPMSSNFSILFRLMFPNFLPASCNYRYVENLVLSLKCGGIFNIYSVVKSDWEAILTKSYCNCILRL